MSKNSDSSKMILVGIVFILCAISLWAVSIIVIPRYFPEMTQRGQFGDSFGAVTSLFSGLAFAGVIWAILYQKKAIEQQQEQIKIQAKELGLQRKELENTREEMEGQKLATRKQNFESSFFQLLKMLDAKYNSVEYQRFIEIDTMRENPETVYENYKNRDAYSKVSEPYEHEGETLIGLTAKGDNAFTAAVLDGANFRVEMYLNSYFSLLFTTFRFIDQADFSKNLKKRNFILISCAVK